LKKGREKESALAVSSCFETDNLELIELSSIHKVSITKKKKRGKKTKNKKLNLKDGFALRSLG
jgi:hypothetical protein